MIYKKDMHRIIQLLLLLLSQYTELIYSTTEPNASPKQSENAVKRYNLQDLVGQAGMQLTPSIEQSPLQGIAGIGSPGEQSAIPKTQTIDVGELLAAAQKAAAKQEVRAKDEDIISKYSQNKKAVDVELSTDKDGNLNLADIPGLSRSRVAGTHGFNFNDLSSLIKQKQAVSEDTASDSDDSNHIVKQEFNLGKQKLEIEAAGKRTTRYTLAKGPDGGLNLVPMIENDPERKYEVLQPKGYEEKAGSRQQMQLTTLSQALYSPFPSEANILHLHLKGKDGKDGKAGNKGPMGVFGPKGPEGPRGPKGDAGTCSAQINGLFECTPDELDSLSNRVDYLEKICKKVENAAKKHVLHSNDISKPSAPAVSTPEETSKKETPKETASEPSKKEKEEKPKVDDAPDKAKKEKVDADKEKEKLKEEAREAIEKEIREEVARRLKEQLTLKMEKETAEKAETRSTKLFKEKDEKDKEDQEKAKSRNEIEQKQQSKSVAKAKDTIENKNRDVFTEENTKKEPEPTKKMSKERSMIDIKAKLKIAELDLMDRVNQAKTGAVQQ